MTGTASDLYTAVENNDSEKVSQLIADGVDIHEIVKHNYSPFIWALIEGNLKIVKLFIEKVEDINKPFHEGQTPLHTVTIEGYIHIVKYFIERGADINKETIEEGMISPLGATPLYLAAQQGHTQILKLLINLHADVNKATDNGKTPLFIASYDRTPINVELLINAGADVNKATNENETPLHTVSKFKNKKADKIFQILIEAGADVNIAMNDGTTPLHNAVYYDRLDLIKVLINAGADVNVAKKNGQKPIDIAIKQRNTEIIDFLRNAIKPKNLWRGWTAGDAAKLDGIFGDDDTAKNFALCPVCMKYVVRNDACMYMSHNCSTEKGYYHIELYNKYKNSEGLIHWCTICGRICKEHNHYNLGAAKSRSSPLILEGKNPFANDCKGEGGGGIEEKLMRFRRLREYARDLQAEVGKITWIDAMNELCEEMWNAPMFRIRTLESMMQTKAFNIPSSNFPLILPPLNNAPNIPFAGNLPIVHLEANEAFTNAMHIDTTNILQFQHKRTNGQLNKHDKPGQQISREAFVEWLKSILENPTAEAFGKCWQYKKQSQLAVLGNAEKANNCDATLHPEEVKAALDITNPEQATLAENYRKAFNSMMAMNQS